MTHFLQDGTSLQSDVSDTVSTARAESSLLMKNEEKCVFEKHWVMVRVVRHWPGHSLIYCGMWLGMVVKSDYLSPCTGVEAALKRIALIGHVLYMNVQVLLAWADIGVITTRFCELYIFFPFPFQVNNWQPVVSPLTLRRRCIYFSSLNSQLRLITVQRVYSPGCPTG